MSPFPALDGAETVGIVPIARDILSESNGDLAPEVKAALVAEAKDILAGRVRPPAMAATPDVLKWLDREFEGFEPPATPDAIRRIAERVHLVATYAGRPVACGTTADGFLVVLASGEHEIEALLDGLSDAERSKVVIMDTYA